MESSALYGKEFKNRNTSLFRGVEYKMLSPESTQNGHALYIAAGGDIWRLMADFPGAKHYHLLDKLTGWGASPIHLIASIKHRLQKFASKVTLVREGFASNLNLSGRDLVQNDPESILQKIESTDLPVSDPIIFEIEVHLSNDKTPIVKYVWIHPFDYSVHDHYTQLFNQIPHDQPVVGCLQAGLTGTPQAVDFNLLLDRMIKNAPYINEVGWLYFPPDIKTDEDRPKLEASLKEELINFLSRVDLEVSSTSIYDVERGRAIAVLVRKLDQTP